MPASDTVDRALSLIQSDKSKILGLTVEKHTIATPGQHVPKADAQAAPELSFATDPSNTYMVIGLDLDAPFPSFSVLGPIVHWIQPGLKADASGSGKLTSSEPFIVNYAGPGPPPPSSPHRYVFLLYEQPPSLDISKHAPANGKEVGVMPRMRYNLAAFEEKVGLGPVVAANYFNSN